MKRLVEILGEQGILFPSLIPLEGKKMGVTRKVSLFLGVDKKSYYHLMIVWPSTTRVLLKDAQWVDATHHHIEQVLGHTIKHCHIWFPHAPVCSKATQAFKNLSWSLYHDPM